MLTPEQRHRHTGGNGDGEKIRATDIEGLADFIANNSAGAKYFVGNSSRNATTGSQAITGVGFQPKMIVIHAVSSGGISNGHATSGSDDYVVYHEGASTFSYVAGRVIYCPVGASNNAAEMTSLDADGFTLNWTSSTGLVTFIYECFG